MEKEAKKKEEGSEVNPIIYYIGKDLSYFNLLKKKFKILYPDMDFKFEHYFEEDKSKVKTIAHKLYLAKPKVIFLDFSCHTHSIIRLGMGLEREMALRETTIIGLLDNIESREILSLILSLGLNLNIVKGIDLTNVVYDVFHLTFPDKCLPHGFATAEIEHTTKVMNKLKIGYFTEYYLHLECDYVLNKEDVVRLKTKIFPDISFPSFFKVKNHGTDSLYTAFNHWYDLEYVHLDLEEKSRLEKKLEIKRVSYEKHPKDVNLPHDINDLEIRLRKLVSEAEKFQKINSDFTKSWIINHREDSGVKRASILIFDSNMTILYESINPLDSYKYSLRQQAFVPDDLSLLTRCKSGVIIFNLDDPVLVPPLPEKKEPTNDFESLKTLTTELSKFKDYTPIIIVFNYKGGAKRQAEIKYKNIIFRKEELTFNKIDELATSYLKKEGRKKTHDLGQHSVYSDNRFYISKYLPYSICEMTHNISIMAISEADIVFKCDDNIPLTSALYLKDPVKMTVTLAPFPQNSKYKEREKHYYGLISGVGEVEKSKLRQHINKLFFTEHDRKKREEKEEFEKKNREAKLKKDS